MKSTRVAAVSMNGYLGVPEQVLTAIDSWCERAAADHAELVLFPELVIHGHCTPNTWHLAESVPDGPSVMRLVQIARRHRLILCAGMSEKERDIVYNTQVLVGPEGYVGKQRKLHLSRDEVFHYKGGRELPAFDVGPCKVGIVICYDNQFPEVARVLALRGADIILMPHAGPGTIRHRARPPLGVMPTTSLRNMHCVLARTRASPCWPIRRGGPDSSIIGRATVKTSPTIRARR